MLERENPGIACAVVSASANTSPILERSSLADLIDVRVDGASMRSLGLLPAPAPDTFLAACEQLGVESEEAAAFVTTPAGIAAARAAGCALVVGLDHARDVAGLRAAGADLVVGDLAELFSAAATAPALEA